MRSEEMMETTPQSMIAARADTVAEGTGPPLKSIPQAFTARSTTASVQSRIYIRMMTIASSGLMTIKLALISHVWHQPFPP